MVRKSFLILTFLTLGLAAATNALAQEKISWHLRQWLMNNSPSEKAEVMVILTDQTNLDSLNQALYGQKSSIQHRQKTTIHTLMANANASQSAFVKSIQVDVNAGKIVINRAFWIANLVTIQTNEAGIKALAANPKVAFIEKTDAYGASWIKPVESKSLGASPDAINGHEIGLEKIKAHMLWEKGYTGRGRLGLSFDTGVWQMHPSIQSRYLANYYPTKQAWKGYDSYYEIDKSSSHGTHTIGTTLGLDPTTNDTIGVAFGAYFSASDPIVEDLNLVKPLIHIIEAFEWSMNPDGDTSTTNDIADAINNSWGFSTVTMPQLCDSNSFVILSFKAVETAGTAIVFSAGNNGPNGPSIGQPQFVNPGLVNTFTIGALDGNSASLPIASFSSRGPSVCGGSGSLLIKPEVSAPGVNVRSATDQSNYGTKSGTSMAGPHVTGAVLLLKEAFPFLTGEQIKLALYYTATDLGTPGEDTIYGMGIINLDSAFTYLSAFYTPVNPKMQHYDIAIKYIQTNIADNRTCDTIINPIVTIENLGDSTIYGFEISAKTSKGISNPFSWSGTLASKQSITLPISTIQLGYNLNEVQFNAQITDTTKIDRDPINNFRIARIFVHEPQSLPFYEGFENFNFTYSKWLVNNPDFTITWDTALINNFPGSNSAAYLNFVSYVQRKKQQDFLTSPKVKLPVGASGMSFYMSYRTRSVNFKDSLFVLASTDCGVNWNDTLYANGANGMNTYANGFWPLDSSYWKKMWFNLSRFSNQNVLFRFVSQNDYGGNLLIDSFHVFSGAIPSGSSSQNLNRYLNVYPNPTTGLVNICCNEDASPTTVIVRNLSGAVVKRINISNPTNDFSISVEEIPAGMYVLEVQQRSSWQVFKLVKTN